MKGAEDAHDEVLDSTPADASGCADYEDRLHGKPPYERAREERAARYPNGCLLQWPATFRPLWVRLGRTQSEHIESASAVRRDKAALSSGCKSHPATAPAGS